ncbi:hypothetical protein FGO68_gene14887 [Halteria grandinella]|uniref:PCI domain-containing protein n=1 Tax=Halteria grandinella TaxID=5974 RepID=A0A8J8NPG7_HALGN|nr:hypothetical protein FGO68_gene14887 [Halteria grandinella]
MCKLMIHYALEADLDSKQNKAELDKIVEYTSAHSRLEKVYTQFQTLFRRMPQCATTSNAPNNATYSVFYLSLRMIKIRFKMNSYKDSESCFKWIDMQFEKENFNKSDFSISWRVTHAYLQGRLHIYKNELPEAREKLRFAFEHSHPGYPNNKRKILKFLIPVEMNLYNFPSEQLLTKYNLTEYLEISQACMKGDMVKFEQALSQNMDNFVFGGVYMIAERLRHLTLRNLIKKVALVVKKEPAYQQNGKASIVKLDLIFNILKEWDSQIDLDEIECIIANLIYMGFIKGYISHEQRLMVLSNIEPFPLRKQ